MQHLHVEKLRRKPEHVEAVFWNPSLGWDYALKLAEWCGGKLSRDQLHPEKTYYWIIHLSEGWTYPNEWIVKHADGSFSVQTNEYMQDFESDSE